MFERYTEKARRSIFFARWEASRFGSPFIEPEHLVLGLARCTNIVDQALRAEIEQIAVHSAPTSTSVDLPVSKTLQRAMHFAAEEAEKLGHEHIGVEHLLLGLMVDEPDSPVSGLLRKHGIDRALVLSQIPDAPVEDPVERESLRALIDRLPPRSLRPAKTMLEHLQGMPVSKPGIHDLWQGRPRLSPGTISGGGGGGWADPTGAKPRGRRSSTRFEDGVEVVETHHFRDGIELTLIERFRLSEDGKTLTYMQEVNGPGRSEQHTIDFNVT
jgi:Clp amino terminal domain, pathogenicity island component